MWPLPRIFPTVHCDSSGGSSALAGAVDTVRSAVAVQETELTRWRKAFEANAKTEAKDEKCVSCHSVLHVSDAHLRATGS